MDSSSFPVEDRLLRKLTGRLMQKGKRAQAEGLLRKTLVALGRGKAPPLRRTLVRALLRICPLVEVKAIRRGGGVFQVPFPLSPSRQLSLGLGWLVAEARRSSLRSFPKALARELAEAARGQGPTVRRRRLQHKLAKANRAFTHFRWA